MPKRSGASARGQRAAKTVKPKVVRRRIDFSDIAEASGKQLHAMRGGGRPPLGDGAPRLTSPSPDLNARARTVFGGRLVKPSGSDTVKKSRGDR